MKALPAQHALHSHPDQVGYARLLEPGVTCWRLASASRAALLIDAASYTEAMAASIRRARRSILLLGWDFDPRVPLAPSAAVEREPERFCDLLDAAVSENPELFVHILIWDMTWSYAIQRRNKPRDAARWLPNHRVHYKVDGCHPPGAAHHQKILVVDDSIAFCGGADFTRNRWDTPAHLPHDPRRRTFDGSIYGPRHDVVLAVDGEAAAALGELARERWFDATGERLAAAQRPPAAWPDDLVADLNNVEVGIARTVPAWRGHEEKREIEALYLRAITEATRWIYFENQYVTSPAVGEALAKRLAEPDGPEVIVVCPLQSGGPFDRLSMDHARGYLFHRLRSADVHGRFQAVAPMADRTTPIYVHSKVMIVDDRLLRVGSANLNNRSFGLDTECDLAIEAGPADETTRDRIRGLLLRLIAEHTGYSADQVEDAFRRNGSLRISLEELAIPAGRHLEPFKGQLTALDRVMGTFHLLDPKGRDDNWRPWLRLGGRSSALPLAELRAEDPREPSAT
jgi:phosphatidylserine/phosphatidylglycerophosphate/cardiolipin synthase-like enzyme